MKRTAFAIAAALALGCAVPQAQPPAPAQVAQPTQEQIAYVQRLNRMLGWFEGQLLPVLVKRELERQAAEAAAAAKGAPAAPAAPAKKP